MRASQTAIEIWEAEEREAQRAIQSATDVHTEFLQYAAHLNGLEPGRFNNQVADVMKRLSQLRIILIRISEILEIQRAFSRATAPDEEIGEVLGREVMEAEWWNRTQCASAEDYQQRLEQYEWLELLTEQFYWCAFRGRTGIQKLPGLKGFEAVGVRNVRNKLIEHNDRDDSRIFNGGFSWGQPHGPVLASLRPEGELQKWQDEGLFVNADEFFSALRQAISRAQA